MSSRLSAAAYQSSSPGCPLVIASTCPGPDQAASQAFSPSGETLASSPEASVYSHGLRQASSGVPASTCGYQDGSPDSPEPTVPDHCASATSAPGPATPSRIRVPSVDHARYSNVHGTAGAGPASPSCPPSSTHSSYTPALA